MDVKKGDRKSYSHSPELVYIKILSELKDSWKPGRLIKVWIRLLMDAASLKRKSVIKAIRDLQAYIYSIDYRKQQFLQ